MFLSVPPRATTGEFFRPFLNAMQNPIEQHASKCETVFEVAPASSRFASERAPAPEASETQFVSLGDGEAAESKDDEVEPDDAGLIEEVEEDGAEVTDFIEDDEDTSRQGSG